MSRIDADIKKEVDDLVDVPPRRFGIRMCYLPTVAQYALVAALGSFQFGYQISVVNTSKDFIIVDFGMCKDYPDTLLSCGRAVIMGSLINSGVFIGMICGCLVAGVVVRAGRKFALLMMNFVFLFASILSASAEGFTTLMIARCIAGIGVGLATVSVPMYISEYTPDLTRGLYGTLHQLLITFGIFVAVLLGLAFGDRPAENDMDFLLTTFQSAWWRVMFGAPSLVALAGILLLTLVYKYESPCFLIEKGKKNIATAFLRELFETDDVSAYIERIEAGICQEKVLSSQSLTLAKAFTFPAYRYVLLLAFFLASFQQITGISVMVANSNQLYRSLKLAPTVVTGLTVGMAALNVLMTLPAVYLMDRLGRRTLLVWGVFGQVLTMLASLIANCFDSEKSSVQWATVGFVYGFIVCFAIGHGPVLWVYLHEMFPPEIKHVGASTASAINGIACIATVIPSDYLFNLDIRIVLSIFVVSCGICFIVSFLFMKETAGRSLEDNLYFQGKQRVMSKYMTNTGADQQGIPVPQLASGYFSATPIAPHHSSSGALSLPK